MLYFPVTGHPYRQREPKHLGYKILIEVLGRGSIGQVAEVGYVFQERQEGESKVTWRQYLDYLRHLPVFFQEFFDGLETHQKILKFIF